MRLVERRAGVDVTLQAVVAAAEVDEVVAVDAAGVRKQVTQRDRRADLGSGRWADCGAPRNGNRHGTGCGHRQAVVMLSVSDLNGLVYWLTLWRAK